MRKKLTAILAAGILGCLALTACSTAYAATGTADSAKAAEEADAGSDIKNDSAQEALDILKDLISRGGEGASKKLQPSDGGAPEAAQPRTITVSASGTSRTVPDKAEISFGVTTQAKTADTAQQENAKTIDTVIAHLKERGIEEKSIRTSGYSLYPDYDYSGNTPKITGYQVRTTLTVTDQDIDDAGDIVTECVSLGINDVDNFRFYASGYDEAYAEALAGAVKAAGDKAAVLAKSAGGELGQVLTLTEGYQDTSARYAKSNVAFAEAAALTEDGGFGMSVMPGETTITAQVTVTYQLQ